MRAAELIARKRDGLPLADAEWDWFVQAFVRGDVRDYQMTAMLMAVYLRGMRREETLALTRAMAASGDQLDLGGRHAADKHSSGGVGDKVTLIVAPVVAACGVPVAKMSGRGLAHTGGTLDKLESIAGLRTRLAPAEFLRVLDRHGLVIAGQSERLAPADASIYALRDVTATVDCIPLLATSIMSKKLAVGAETILLDVKMGSGAFMQSLADARRLARLMVEIGRDAGRRTEAVVTDMDEPLGRAVGNALEVREAVDVLRGEGPADLRDLCLDEAAHLLHLAGGAASRAAARSAAAHAIASHRALDIFTRMASAQGGDPRHIAEPERLPVAPVIREVRASRRGYIARLDALRIGRLVMSLGAGRAVKDGSIRHDTGIVLRKVHGDAVDPGEPLAEIHAGSAAAADAAAAHYSTAVTWSAEPPAPRRLILARIK
ncbi:MAG: thymidine phosphorylase [Dehalococcoidia bacterium]